MDIYRGFTCVKDILIYLEMCEEEQTKVFDRLDKIKIGLFDPDRKELSQERKDLKQKLRIIKFRIEKCVEILENNTTFNNRVFLNFLAKYLSLKEGTEYALMDITEDNVGLGIATKTYGCMASKYNVVTTANNKKLLEKQGSSGTFGATTDDINEYFRVCKDKKYICLLDEKNYTLLDGSSLREGFERYTYLQGLAFRLVDLKIQNPKLSDEKRLNMVLGELQNAMFYSKN